MARNKTPNLTEAELRLMKIIWKLKEGTVNDVLDNLPNDLNLAYNTVLTIMRILEQKKYLKRIKKSRAHIYQPIVSENQARKNVVKHMLDNFFNGSPELLLQNIFENENLSDDEIDLLKDIINEKKRG